MGVVFYSLMAGREPYKTQESFKMALLNNARPEIDPSWHTGFMKVCLAETVYVVRMGHNPRRLLLLNSGIRSIQVSSVAQKKAKNVAPPVPDPPPARLLFTAIRELFSVSASPSSIVCAS